MRERALFHSIKDLWNSMLSMVEQMLEGKFAQAIKSRNFDPFTLHSCKLLKHCRLEAIAAMMRVRVQEPFLWKQKIWNHLKDIHVEV